MKNNNKYLLQYPNISSILFIRTVVRILAAGDEMGIKVTLGCSICGYSERKAIEIPFNCDNVICPKCKENTLSITAMHDNCKVRDKVSKIDEMMAGLYKIRKI